MRCFFRRKKADIYTKTAIFLRLVNLDINETYRINFNFSKGLQIYEIPTGKYKINSSHGMTDFIQDN